MYRFWNSFLLVTVWAVAALAGEGAATSVVAVSADDIRSDSSVLPERGFVSTGQPDSEVLEQVAAAGFVAVVDLRTDGEDRGIDEQSEVERLGMQYVSLPVSGSADFSFAKAAELDRLLGEFDGPVLLHCGSGNRVGALFALRASLNGASADEALEEGTRAGLTRSKSLVEQRLQEKQPQ